jgi:CheY-like chemotaxis protein
MTGHRANARCKVLLVDDSVLVLRIASAYLADNYDVITGSSGEEALRKAVAERPDVILMDMHMTGQSGAQTADSLGRDQRTHHIPVIIMTTAAEFALLPAHIERLTKPFDKQAVLAKIQDCLGGPLSRPMSE